MKWSLPSGHFACKIFGIDVDFNSPSCPWLHKKSDITGSLCAACNSLCSEDSYIQRAYSFLTGTNTAEVPTQETLKEKGAPSHETINELVKKKGIDLEKFRKKKEL